MRPRTRRHKLYVVTTNDIYELPVLVGPATECADFIGVKLASLKTIMSRQKSGTLKGNCVKYKVFPLNILEEENEGI